MPVRNNVIRLLQSRGVPYTAHEFPPQKLGAVEMAALLKIKPDQVFKTIVVYRIGSNKHILAVVPGPKQVDLKAVARQLNEKKVRLPTEREAERLTGLEAGGISPLALLHRSFTVILDEAANEYPQIIISGGQRGLNIELPVSAFIALTGALQGEISRLADPG